jgi:hypothetical protein
MELTPIPSFLKQPKPSPPSSNDQNMYKFSPSISLSLSDLSLLLIYGLIIWVKICLFAEKKKKGKRKYMAMKRNTQPARPTRATPTSPTQITDGFVNFTVHCGLEFSKPDGHGSNGRTGRNLPEPTYAQPYPKDA